MPDEGLTFGFNLLVQCTLLAILALIVVRLLKHQAELRHAVLLSVLVCIAIGPVLVAAMQLSGYKIASFELPRFGTNSPSPFDASLASGANSEHGGEKHDSGEDAEAADSFRCGWIV